MSREAIQHIFIAAFCFAIAAIPAAVWLIAPDAPGLSGKNAVIRLELPPPRSGGAAPVAFDLSARHAQADAASPVEIVKTVQVNGIEAGKATIRVDARSNLAVSTDELGRLLARAGHGDVVARLPGERFIGFEELGRQGIDVRYEAASDLVRISL